MRILALAAGIALGAAAGARFALPRVRQRQLRGRLEDMTRDELYDLARERDIEGRSSMTKDELIAALRSG